jgi:elongation factor G
MAQMLSYAPDLRSITGGRGEFAMEFLRYEELPAQLATRVVEQAKAEREAVKA